MRGQTAAFISMILSFIEIATVVFYMLFFSGDYSLDTNKHFMERFSNQLKDNYYKSYYMNKFEKAFPYQDEERGLVGNNWFSITLEYCLIPAVLLIVFAGINFIMNHYQLVNLKCSLLLFIISLILIIISFINAFCYVDHVNMPDKDIYIFDFLFNLEIKERMETIKLAKDVYIAGNLFLFIIVCIHLIFTLIIYSDAKEKDNEFLINSSNEAKKVPGSSPTSFQIV
jgi:hypothetical protein